MRAEIATTCRTAHPSLSRHLQSIRNHSIQQVGDVVLVDEKGRAKPLRMVSQMLANPFACFFCQGSNERQCALWQNPDVGFTSRAVHCLLSVFANGGCAFSGNAGRKRATVCDVQARETVKNDNRRLTLGSVHHPSPETVCQSS